MLMQEAIGGIFTDEPNFDTDTTLKVRYSMVVSRAFVIAQLDGTLKAEITQWCRCESSFLFQSNCSMSTHMGSRISQAFIYFRHLASRFLLQRSEVA